MFLHTLGIIAVGLTCDSVWYNGNVHGFQIANMPYSFCCQDDFSPALKNAIFQFASWPMVKCQVCPEVCSGMVPCAQSDLYALGSILHELMSGVHPNCRKRETTPAIRARFAENSYNKKFVDYVNTRLLNRNPESRGTTVAFADFLKTIKTHEVNARYHTEVLNKFIDQGVHEAVNYFGKSEFPWKLLPVLNITGIVNTIDNIKTGTVCATAQRVIISKTSLLIPKAEEELGRWTIVSQIVHPNVDVPIGVYARMVDFTVFPVYGMSDPLARTVIANHTTPNSIIARMMVQIINGLHALHSRGIAMMRMTLSNIVVWY